MAVVP